MQIERRCHFLYCIATAKTRCDYPFLVLRCCRLEPRYDTFSRLAVPDLLQEARLASFSPAPGLAGRGHSQQTGRPGLQREAWLGASSSTATAARWTSHSATEARPPPLQSCLKTAKAKSEFNLDSLWQVLSPKRVSFAPDVEEEDGGEEAPPKTAHIHQSP